MPNTFTVLINTGLQSLSTETEKRWPNVLREDSKILLIQVQMPAVRKTHTMW